MGSRILTMVLFLISPCLSFAQSVKVPEEIKAGPGRLIPIVIDYEGEDVRWDVPPQLDAFREFETDAKKVRLRVYVPPGTVNGTYRLLVIAASKEGKLSDFAACRIVVEGSVPLPPPKPPDPPKPPPIPPPSVDKLGFITLSRSELVKVDPAYRPKAGEVADNFDAVASKLAAGSITTIKVAQDELREMNRGTLDVTARTAWLPWFTAWQTKADAMNKAGTLSTNAHYVQAFTETAAGLRLAAPKKGP